jgi:hypothetical protein
MKERKELAVGENREQAILSMPYNTFDPLKHELVYDASTKLWSVFNRRRKSDRTIKRAITRESRGPYANGYGRDRRPVLVTLHPRELIETRLKGRRTRHVISWDALHQYLVRRDALAAVRAKQAQRKAKLDARRAERKLNRKG